MPDEVWRAVMGNSQDVLCVMCWDWHAIKADVPWDDVIELFAVDHRTARRVA